MRAHTRPPLSDGAEAVTGDPTPRSEAAVSSSTVVPESVACPDCAGAATVLSRFTLPGADGPVEYLRIRCSGPLTLLIPVAEARTVDPDTD